MPHARTLDPSTSHQAAASVRNISTTHEAILKALRSPMSDQSLVNMIQHIHGRTFASESGIRSRRAELVELGLVKDTGVRVRLASGRAAIIWSVA